MMQTCNEITIDLKAFVDGELSAAQKSAVEHHINGCPDCRRELGEIQRISSQLQTLDTAMPRPELRARILAQVVPVEAPVPRRPKVPFFRLWMPSLALAGTAAAAVVLAVITHKSPPVSTLESMTQSSPKTDAPTKYEESKPAGGHPAKALAKSPPVDNSIVPKNTISEPKDRSASSKESTFKPSGAPQIADGKLGQIPLSQVNAHAESEGVHRRNLQTPVLAAPSQMPGKSEAQFDKFGATDLSASGSSSVKRKDNKPIVEELQTAKKASAPSTSSPLGLIAPSTTQPTVDIVVDHLESGVSMVNAAAKAEGATVERSPNAAGAAPEALFFVTVPAQNYEALKNRLSTKDANTYYTHFSGGAVLKADALSNGALGRAVRQPANANNLSKDSLRGLKGEPSGGGGFGGYGGGGAQSVQQNAAKPVQQSENTKRDQYNRNSVANSQASQIPRGKTQEQRSGNVKGELNSPESKQLLKEQNEKLPYDKKLTGQYNFGYQNQSRAGGGRGAGKVEDKSALQDRAGQNLNTLEMLDQSAVKLTIRLREQAKPAARTKQP